MNFYKPDFTSDELALAKAHMVSCYPNEGCGIFSNGKFYACENVAEDKEKDAVISPEQLASFEHIDAIVHSHPTAKSAGRAFPSARDMETQMAHNCPFGVFSCNDVEVFDTTWWGDFTLELPLIGRKFVHGVTDCYALARAYLWQVKKVYVSDMPRDDEWWLQNKNLYIDHYKSNGFKLISRSEVVSGDFFIGQIRSPVPNHGGVLLENGLGLHHLAGDLSRREPIFRWERFMTHFFRYEGET